MTSNEVFTNVFLPEIIDEFKSNFSSHFAVFLNKIFMKIKAKIFFNKTLNLRNLSRTY